MADERLLAGELAPAEQTGQLLPVSELLLPFGTPAFLLFLTVALPAVGCHQAPRWALENARVGEGGQAQLDWSPYPSAALLARATHWAVVAGQFREVHAGVLSLG